MRFIKYHPDSDMAKYLQSKPIANHLANIIATRARRTDCNYTGLKVGQCYLGDVKKMGITPKQYRTAKLLLEKIGFSTFLGTNKGTTATLVSIEVYDINAKDEGQTIGQTKGEQGGEQGANKGRQTKNVKESKEVEESKELKKEQKTFVFISEIRQILDFFKNTTGKAIRIGKTDSLLARSDKYKSILPRLKEGATVEECKAIITAKTKEWKGNKRMEGHLCISTLFRKSKFEKYLDEVSSTIEKAAPKQFLYEVPSFETEEERYMYFLARYSIYKESGMLDEYKANTEYRRRTIHEQDAENVCFELELEQPELLNLEFNYTVR